MQSLIKRMKRDIRVEVFDENTIEIIEDTRVITDLKTLSTEVMKQGPVLLVIKKAQSFLEVVRRLTSIDDIFDDEIKDNIKSSSLNLFDCTYGTPHYLCGSR